MSSGNARARMIVLVAVLLLSAAHSFRIVAPQLISADRNLAGMPVDAVLFVGWTALGALVVAWVKRRFWPRRSSG